MRFEIIRGSSQVVDMLAAAPFSHGGDTGSKPVGTAKNIRGLWLTPIILTILLLTFCQHFFPTEVAPSLGFFFFGA